MLQFSLNLSKLLFAEQFRKFSQAVKMLISVSHIMCLKIAYSKLQSNLRGTNEVRQLFLIITQDVRPLWICLYSLPLGDMMMTLKLISELMLWILLVKLLADECHQTSLIIKWKLVQVMSWCCQATSHYLGQCWFRFMSPYDVTSAQWVKDVTVLTVCTDTVLLLSWMMDVTMVRHISLYPLQPFWLIGPREI